jgi:hypothetical protein
MRKARLFAMIYAETHAIISSRRGASDAQKGQLEKAE